MWSPFSEIICPDSKRPCNDCGHKEGGHHGGGYRLISTKLLHLLFPALLYTCERLTRYFWLKMNLIAEHSYIN